MPIKVGPRNELIDEHAMSHHTNEPDLYSKTPLFQLSSRTQDIHTHSKLALIMALK